MEGGFVEGVWEAEESLEGLKLLEGDAAILVAVDDARQKAHRFLIVFLGREDTEVLEDKVLRGHVQFAILVDGGVLAEYIVEELGIRPFYVTDSLSRRANKTSEIRRAAFINWIAFCFHTKTKTRQLPSVVVVVFFFPPSPNCLVDR